MTPVYELHNLVFEYNGERIVDIPRFSIDENSIIALVGPNGSGKTTLLSLLAFLLEPASGELRFFRKLPDRKPYETRRRIGFVQQAPYLFNVSVLENVELGLKLRGVNKSLRRARAMHVLEQLNLDKLAAKRAHELSGGEVQKAALARVLVLEPEVILLDEPFTYLDRDFAGELEALLLSIRENRSQTVVFSSHDTDRAGLIADRVCRMENGRLLEEMPVNIFHGTNRDHFDRFSTRHLEITLADVHEPASVIAVESDQIVLARHAIDSSMRNQFRGEVVDVNDRGEHVLVMVNVGEKFTACISHAARRELGLEKGQRIWISFKSSAIRVLR